MEKVNIHYSLTWCCITQAFYSVVMTGGNKLSIFFLFRQGTAFKLTALMCWNVFCLQVKIYSSLNISSHKASPFTISRYFCGGINSEIILFLENPHRKDFFVSLYSFGMTPEKESVLEVTYYAEMSFTTLLTSRLDIPQNVHQPWTNFQALSLRVDLSNGKMGDSASYFIFSGNVLV